jgi:hypothetical protein
MMRELMSVRINWQIFALLEPCIVAKSARLLSEFKAPPKRQSQI